MIDRSLQVEDMATEVVPEPPSVVGAEETGHHDIRNDRDIHDDHDENEEDPIVPRRLSRARNKTQFYGHLVNTVMLNEPDKPANYKEAMEGPESEKWLEAMKSEIDSMNANKVWTLVDIPEDYNLAASNWHFTKNIIQYEKIYA